MNALLEDIFQHGEFRSKDGTTVKIHSETPRAQCEFLQNIIEKNIFKNSIEIGLAYGISALAITEAVVNNGGKHLAIDKYQFYNDGWQGYGVEILEQAGYKDNFEFVEKLCYEALPLLLAQGRKFDFAYIDSSKNFDWVMVDFFFLDKLLVDGGIIVFDDVYWPGIRKAVRYISQIPSYRVHAAFPSNVKSMHAKISPFVKAFPGAKKLFKEEILLSDYRLKINSQCVALKKIGEDKRKWDWHVSF